MAIGSINRYQYGILNGILSMILPLLFSIAFNNIGLRHEGNTMVYPADYNIFWQNSTNHDGVSISSTNLYT